MSDLFKEYGIEYNAKTAGKVDLFKENNIVPPTTAESNRKTFAKSVIDMSEFTKADEETGAAFVDKRTAELNTEVDKKEEYADMAETLDMYSDPLTNPAWGMSLKYREDANDLRAEACQIEESKEMLSKMLTPERLAELQNAEPIGALEMAKKNLKWGNAPFVGAFVEGAQKSRIASLIERVGNGEELSDEENKIVGDYLSDYAETTIRGVSFSGKVVDGVAKMPAFMIEYGVAKGLFSKVGTAAKSLSAVSKASKAIEAASATSKAVKYTAKAAGVVTTAAGRAMFMPGTVYGNYADMHMNEVFSLAANGQILLTENQEQKAITALKAFGLSTITALAEDSGDAITALAKKGVSPIYTRLPPNIRNGLVELARKTEKFKNASVSEMFSKVGYSNMLAEIGEERLEDFLGAVTGLNPQDENYIDSIGKAIFPGWEEFLVEAGVLSVAGATRSGLSYLANRGYPAKFLSFLTTQEQDALVEKEIEKQIAEENAPQSLADMPISEEERNAYAVVEIPINEITLSEEVPNFKEGANARGVVTGNELTGTYRRLGTPPIVVWERLNGKKEVITGRHRLDLARRTGEVTIPAQIVREADGFTANEAALLDAESNIIDEKGSAKDYVRFFIAEKGKYDRKTAELHGLLSRALGRNAFDIATLGTSDTVAGVLGGRISAEKAAGIANAAPNNEAVQSAGLKYALEHPNKSASFVRTVVEQIAQMPPSAVEQGDLFGKDDGYIKTMEAIAKAKEKDRVAISERIRVVTPALRHPEAAKDMGLTFEATPENIQGEIDRLKATLDALDKWATNPVLSKHYQNVAKGIDDGFNVFTDIVKSAPAIEESPVDDSPGLFDMDVLPSKTEWKAEESRTAEKQDKRNDKETAEAAGVDDSETWFEAFYRRVVDTVAPLQNLSNAVQADIADFKRKYAEKMKEKFDPKDATLPAGMRPDLLARGYQYARMMIQKNIEDRTYYIDEYGNEVDTGEGLIPILRDFEATMHGKEKDSVKAREDLEDYLIAQRYLYDLEPNEEVEVTKKQLSDSISDLARLEEKYGEDYAVFEDFARRIYDFQIRILDNFVRSGNMSQEEEEELKKKHQHYVPFQRVLGDDEQAPGFSIRGLFDGASKKRVIKKIKGSDKDVKDVFVSMMMNSAKTIDLAYRNRIARAVAGMGEYMPELIKPVKPQYVPALKTHVKVSFDKGLDEALDIAIKQMGGKYERVKRVGLRIGRGITLGAHFPQEKLIQERIGVHNAKTHEVGHMMDHNIGLGKAILTAETREELQDLAEERLTSKSFLVNGRIVQEKNYDVTEDFMGYIKNDREVVANAFDCWVNAPELMKKVAPKTYKKMQEFVENTPHKWVKDIHTTMDKCVEDVEQQSFQLVKPYGNVIEYWTEGKRRFMEVSKPLYETMHHLNPIQVGWLQKILSVASIPAKVLRFGATTTPNFILRNFVKDQFTAMVQTEAGEKTTPANTVKALFAIMGKEAIYSEWQKSGGAGGGYYDWSEKGTKAFIDEMNDKSGRFWKAAKWALSLQFIQKPSQMIEEATRLGAYEAAKKNGKSDLEAGIASREATVDFGRSGDVSKMINRFVPFFNVGVQSADKLLRTFKRDPVSTTLWAFSTVAFPSIMIAGYYLYGAPEDERKKWLEIPDYVRDNNWVFFIKGKEEPITFPKPFTVGYIGTALEDFLIWGFKGEKPEARNLWELSLGAAGSLSPLQTVGSLLTPVGQAVIEGMTNYNFFQGRPIYPVFMDRLPPEERTTRHDSKIATIIGKKTGTSPAIVDNTLNALFSTLGRQTIKAGEMAVDEFRRWNGEKVPRQVTFDKDIPIVGAVIGMLPDGSRSKSYQNFAKEFKRLSEIHASFAAKKGDEKAEMREKNEKDLLKYDIGKQFHTRISAIRKEINAVYDDMDMPSDKKVENVIELEKQITEVARSANAALRSVGD